AALLTFWSPERDTRPRGLSGFRRLEKAAGGIKQSGAEPGGLQPARRACQWPTSLSAARAAPERRTARLRAPQTRQFGRKWAGDTPQLAGIKPKNYRMGD